jgi:hypothetical protein
VIRVTASIAHLMAAEEVDLTQTLVLGAVSSAIASVMILLVAPFVLRPRISISDEIAKMTNRQGEVVYRIKIVNRRMVKAVNLSIEVAKLKRVGAINGGWKDEKDRLVTRPAGMAILPRYKLWEQYKKVEKQDAEFAFRFSIPHDVVDGVQAIETDLADETTRIRVRVYAEHPLSRSVRYAEQVFSHPNCVKAGDFPIGKILKIVPVSP